MDLARMLENRTCDALSRCMLNIPPRSVRKVLENLLVVIFLNSLDFLTSSPLFIFLFSSQTLIYMEKEANRKKKDFKNQFHHSAHKYYPNNPFRNHLTASTSFISVSAQKLIKKISNHLKCAEEEEKAKINHCPDAIRA